MKSKTVASILRHVASKLSGEEVRTEAAVAGEPIAEGEADDVLGPTGGSEESRLRALYEQIAWPLGTTYGHPYDAFKLALTCVTNICYRYLSSQEMIVQRAGQGLRVPPRPAIRRHPRTIDPNNRSPPDATAHQIARGH